MSDWEAIQAEIERKRNESIWSAQRSDSEAQARQRIADESFVSLKQRLAQFESDLKGHLHVGIELRPTTTLAQDALFQVSLSRKPIGWTLADRKLLVGVQGPRFMFVAPGTGREREGTLGAIMDEVVREAAEVVASPEAPYRTKGDEFGGRAQEIVTWLYVVASVLVGSGAGIATWVYMGQEYGLAGGLLGWIPGIVIGLLVGLLWGVAAFCAFVYWLWAAKTG